MSVFLRKLNVSTNSTRLLFSSPCTSIRQKIERKPERRRYPYIPYSLDQTEEQVELIRKRDEAEMEEKKKWYERKVQMEQMIKEANTKRQPIPFWKTCVTALSYRIEAMSGEAKEDHPKEKKRGNY